MQKKTETPVYQLNTPSEKKKKKAILFTMVKNVRYNFLNSYV